MVFRKKNEVNFLLLLIQAADNTLQAAQMFRSAMMGDKPPASYYAALKEMEHKGDQFTHDIIKGLNQVFMTPLDREDIMELALKLDDVIDGIEACIARFDYLNISYTDDYMKNFSAIIVSSCNHILSAFKLLEAKKFLPIREHTIALNKLENEADTLMRESIRNIFTHPKDPYEDFKLKELYERLEETTDRCEDVANILESVLLRYS
ncbi:MAG: DUF47 family protein [Paenibacillaceae bacterium]|uniref:DUF47 domain-containing protein n=1 Tax=Paenibacillus cymbidii TaxID=1639034 RepID=UPI0010814A2D|nr:DUF47 family protein [Paenibacillus cymbidii]MBO9604487.1 DUF47 family protein [Paenibacillaceae bacterium]